MPSRREFIAQMAAATAALTVPIHAIAQGSDPSTGDAAAGPTTVGGEAAPKQDALGPLMAQRRFGRHDLWVSVLCLGGYHLGQLPEKQAAGCLDTALERGLRFLDTAVMYQSGGSESRYGKLLGKRREHCFLMTKSYGKTAKAVSKELSDSLRRLNTDYVDLWQIHGIQTPEDVDNRIKDGVLDVFLKAKEEGKAKYLGFTGHDRFQAHLHMLDRLEELGVELDACQMPINVIDPHWASFTVNVLPKLVERGYAVLAMKTLAQGHMVGGSFEMPVPHQVSLQEVSDFVLSYPVTSRVIGFDSIDHLEQAFEHLEAFTMLDEAQQAEILKRTKRFNGPNIEYYKRNAERPDKT